MSSSSPESDLHIPQSLMIDPSLLFSETGAAWLQINIEFGVEPFVPRSVYEWLEGERGLDPALLLAPEDVEEFDRRLESLRESGLVDGLRRFDYRDVDLSDVDREILEGLLVDGDNPAAGTWADEWAYLQSNSWLTSKIRRCIDAFRDADAILLEFGRKTGINLIAEVIPREHIPPSINRETVAKALVKWIVVGGASAGGGTLVGAVGTAVGGPLGTVIGHRVGAEVAKRLAKGTLLAIDP